MERERNGTADSWNWEQCPLVLGPASAVLASGPVVECREPGRKNPALPTLKFKAFFLSLNGLAGAERGELLLGGSLR